IAEKVSSLEEGLISTEEIPCAKHVRPNKKWKQLIQCVKLILYLELVLFVGWLCYAMWQTYRTESIQAKVMDNIGKVESEALFEHSAYERTTNSYDYSYQVDNILMKNLLLDDLVVSKESSKMRKNEPDNRESDVTTSTMKTNLQNEEEEQTNDEQERNKEREKNVGQEEENEEQEEKYVERAENEEQAEKKEEQEEKNVGQEEENEEQEEKYVERAENEEQAEKKEEQEEENEKQEEENEEQEEENEEQEETNEGQTKEEALHTSCNDDSECIDGAHCIQRNTTTTSGKRCYCQEGYYEESPLLCSGSASTLTLHTTFLLITLSIVKRSFSSL
ncbi:hypothetical protein WN48_00933, partial [Eufriesea mexicana]